MLFGDQIRVFRLKNIAAVQCVSTSTVRSPVKFRFSIASRETLMVRGILI
jgi:hypothetical protein